jgi:AraC-like DNA-binding protein
MPVYCELAPDAALARWVECGWFLESAAALTNHRVPPDGCIDIIYDRRDGLRAIGAMTTEQRFAYPESAFVAGIRFRPGMAGPFLGVAPAELTDRSAPLEEICRGRVRELHHRVEDAISIRDAVRILLANLPPPAAAPNPVQRAIESAAAAKGNVNADHLASSANLSPRGFRRRCLEESGLGPKRLCRVLRFRHACTLARASVRPDWAAIAVDAGYFDQAHFIHDFREFTGLTPMAVFSNTAHGRSG